MKTPAVRRRNTFRLSHGIKIAAFILTATVLAFSSFSVRSGALTETGAPTESPQSPSIPNSTVSSRFSNAFLLPQAAPPAIATFEATCTTADSDFNLDEDVCAHATSTGGSTSGRRITWVDPQGFIRKSTPITADTQDDTFEIPDTSTTVLANGQEVSNIGKWRVNIVSRTGALVTYAVFAVKDPDNAQASLTISKRAPSDAERLAAGSVATFDILIENYGPDDAQNVIVTDRVPANTTFVAMIQTSLTPNPGFTCDTVPDANDDVRCTISSLASGATASFDFAVTINNGTPAGTLITNTAKIESDTADNSDVDNSSSATITVTGGGGVSTCTLDCPPNINTQANTTDQDDNPGAIVHFNQPTTEGTCGTITADHCNDCFFPVGTTVVTFSSTTGDECSFAVTVSPPNTGGATTISCPANKSGTADGSCNTVFSLGNATASGTNVTLVAFRSDGKPVFTCDAFGNCARNNQPDPGFSVGTTTVTWSAYSHDVPGPYTGPVDSEGQPVNPEDTEEGHRTGTASCTQTVFVEDVTAPTIGATDETIAADATCQAAVPDYSNTVSDNCACSASDESEDCQNHNDIVYTQTPAAGTMVGIGPHTIHIEASDGTNTATKDITLTVTDQTPPVIDCPDNITTTTDPGSCSAVVNPGTATATDNCDSSPTITGTRSDSQALNAPYPKGTTTITWRATDDAGNYSECEQTVTVNDEEDPVIVCPAPTTASADASCQAAIPDRRSEATTSDNCGDVTVTQDPEPGTMVGLGTHTITLTATDSSGNTSTCTTTFTVVDTTAPTFTFTGTQTMWPPNHKYKTFTVADLVASVQDNCNSIPISSVVITKVTSDEIENGNGDGNTLNDIVIAANCKSVQLRSEREGGSNGRVYTIFFSVTDAAGNVGTGTTKVVVPHNIGGTAVDSGPHYTVMSNCP